MSLIFWGQTWLFPLYFQKLQHCPLIKVSLIKNQVYRWLWHRQNWKDVGIASQADDGGVLRPLLSEFVYQMIMTTLHRIWEADHQTLSQQNIAWQFLPNPVLQVCSDDNSFTLNVIEPDGTPPEFLVAAVDTDCTEDYISISGKVNKKFMMA